MIKQLLLLSVFNFIINNSGKIIAKKKLLHREKKSLIFPEGGSKLLAICGFGIPVDLNSDNVILGTVIKANYKFPTNSTTFTDPFTNLNRKQRSLTRWDLYSLLEQALEMRGFNGKACLLRAICEVAHSPLVKNLGLFHELIHTFLTPTSTKERIIHHSDNEYYAAEFFGLKMKNCREFFKDCVISFVDIFTVLEFIK